MTQSPFRVGTRVARVRYYDCIPHVTEAEVVKVTPSGRFQVKFPHAADPSESTYEPKLQYVPGPGLEAGKNEWRGKKRGGGWCSDPDWQVWDESVDAMVEKRKRIDRSARLLGKIKAEVIQMRATWEGAEERIQKLAEVLGITDEGGE